MHMQRMRSLQKHPFGGRELEKGSTFYANPQEQRVLTTLGRAIPISEDMAPIISEDAPSRTPVRKRGYNRRDMRSRSVDESDYETK